jgi:hypothetical protein
VIDNSEKDILALIVALGTIMKQMRQDCSVVGTHRDSLS